MSELLSRLIILVAGTLYPAYRSYKAVRTKDVREYVKWMMYWIVFAVFCLAETVADTLLSFWFPFYYYVKIVFVVWLLSPWTKGSSILYRKWIHPTLAKHEKDIDAMLDQAKSESYNQMVRLGSRGLMCARDIVATAALRGQEQLVQQIQRSYSMSDVGREEPRKRAEVTGIVEMDEPGSDDERRGGGRARSMGYPAAAAGDSRAESENRDVGRSSRSRSRSRSRQSPYGDDSIGEYHSATMPLRRNPRRY